VDRHPRQVKHIVGYLPELFGTYDRMRVWEYLDFFGRCYGMTAARRRQMIGDLLELVDLADKKGEYVQDLSRGMQQRLCLAHALVHDPQVLLLDEPASGLDPRARVEIKELLKELKAMGKTILVSSHILPELADFCNKIGIIEQGELIISGDVGEIMRKVQGGKALQITLGDDCDKAVALLSQLPNVKAITRNERSLRVEFAGDDVDNSEVLRTLIENGLRVESFTETHVDLEDIFMKVTRGIVS